MGSSMKHMMQSDDDKHLYLRNAELAFLPVDLHDRLLSVDLCFNRITSVQG
jgi:hypothetical protein